MKTPCLRKTLAAFLAVAGLALCPAAQASTFKISVDSGGDFNVTRSGDVSAAENVYVRAVSRSALAGIHFGDYFLALHFAAGETGYSVDEVGYPYTVSERNATTINDPRFTYYQSGGATGASRAYRLEVVDEGGFVLAAVDRTINYPSANSVSSSAFDTNSILVVNSSGVTVTDKGFTQAYHAVPCESYLSSLPREYLSASDARIHMTLDFQAAEVSDGYQYVQILTNNTSTCDNSADGGNPGSPSLSCYLAGFDHKHSGKDTNYKKYAFPVTSAGSNSGSVSTPWSDLGNDIGDLCQQYFRPGTRAADGRIALLPSISSLGVRFDASGSDNDDWTVKSVNARLQAVPAGPTLIGNPVVTPAPVCKGSVATVSLVFNEIVSVSGPLVLTTTWGDLSYVAGSGSNVLTFSGAVTAAAGMQLRLASLSGGTVKGITGTSFAWSGRIDVNRTVDSLPIPPRDAVGAYLLSTPAHLRWFADRVASYPQTSAALAADIELSNSGSFSAMGGASGFMGTFDGRGHAIAGIKVDSPDSSGASPARIGLFGQIAAQGVVTNLVLTNANVSASETPALVGAVCGRNLGTIALCSVSGGLLSTGPRSADGTGSALGGVCGENAGVVRACRVVGPLTSSGSVLFNRVKNDAVGGVAGVNAASGTLESCYFHAGFSNVENVNITRGSVCGSNAGAIRRCAGLHENSNYFGGAVGSNSGTVEDTTFPATAAFSSGEVCYALNGGVTDGSQPWYQGFAYPVDVLPQFSRKGDRTVYFHGGSYVNTITHSWTLTSAGPSPDYSNFVWTVTCSVCGETATLTATGTGEVTYQPTCTESGETIWTYVPPANDYGIVTTNAVLSGAPPALGHDWDAPEYTWAADGSSCTASASCTRLGCGATTNETAAATLVPELSPAPTCTVPGTNTFVVAFSSPVFAPQTNAFEVAAGHVWDTPTYVWSADNSTVTASNACTRCGEIVQETVDTTHIGATSPTCTEPGTMTFVADFTSPAFTRQEKTVQTGTALGHDWSAPVWDWNADYTAATATFVCSRCDAEEAVVAAVERIVDGASIVSTATAVHHGETFTDTASVLATPWKMLQLQLDAGGTVTLTNDVTATAGDATLTITNAVTLDLNGHVLDAANQFGVIEVCAGGDLMLTNSVEGAGAVTGGNASYGGVYVDDGGTFTMTNGEISGNTASDDGGGVYVSGGTFTMFGGAISGNVADDDLDGAGGGVYLNGGTFTMTGGAISGNVADYDGGGVFVTDGTFTMTGGAISGNSSTWAGGVEVYGTFTMSGGEISGNAASYDGGGLFVDYGGAFTMDGGEISGNTASDGGGVYVYYGGTFTMSGGEVSGNAASYDGGGVYLNGGTFTVSGIPVVYGNTNSVGAAKNVYLCSGSTITVGGLSAGASIGVTTKAAPTESSPVTFATDAAEGEEEYFSSDNPAFAVDAANGELRLRKLTTPWDLLQAQLDAGGVVTLTNDVTATSVDATLTITNAVTLDLNGHTIDADGNFQVIKVRAGGDLTLTNSVEGAGAVTGGNASRGGGVYVNSGGTFTMAGGAISGNAASDDGGGVYVNSGGTFTMSGGAISGNTASDDGGGVYVSGGTFTMSGGAISGNAASDDGGGLFVNYGTFTMDGGAISGNSSTRAGGLFVNYGTFTMDGGEISGNTADDNCGGVYMYGGTFTMTGGEISGNAASDGGGGLFVNYGTFTVSGSSVVYGNTNSVGAAKNVYLSSGVTITVDGLSSGASIGVATEAVPTASSSVTFATGALEGDEEYFSSDDSGCHVERDGSSLLLVDGVIYKDPQGNEIQDFGVVSWLSDNGFTQADIDGLGSDSAATDRLYECWLLNLNFTVQDAGATLSFTDITVSNRVSMTVQLVRKAPLAGRINGYLYLYGANDLAAGFGSSPIPDESVEYFTGDPSFNLDTASNDTVTQTAVGTLNSVVTANFFKAEIGVPISNEPEDPWEPEPDPDDPDPNDPDPDDPDPDDPEE